MSHYAGEYGILICQLVKIVSGYETLVKSLNDELVSELIEKDELTAAQDDMLETISELTDDLV